MNGPAEPGGEDECSAIDPSSAARADGVPVDVAGLSVRRSGATVLSEVSLAAAPGELLGIVGPNGAGKTTLLRAMNGTLPVASGAVRVGDASVADLDRRALSRRVATVPQETALSFAFTVREVVAMGRHPHRSRLDGVPGAAALGLGDGDHDELIETAMARTDVARFADRPVSAVSGGERRRVLLARALAQDAPVTLLDEPTASLDVTHAVRTLSMARRMAAEGRTVVAAIHDLDLAARFCDRLALLADGTLVAAGAPDEVLESAALERAFGGPVRVTTDGVTGAPRVTALSQGAAATTDGAAGGTATGETDAGTDTAPPAPGDLERARSPVIDHADVDPDDAGEAPERVAADGGEGAEDSGGADGERGRGT